MTQLTLKASAGRIGKRFARWGAVGLVSVSLLSATMAGSWAQETAGAYPTPGELALGVEADRPVAPGATPFTTEQLGRAYPSDIPTNGNYLALLDEFVNVQDNRPDLIESNLNKVFEINSGADAQTQARAIFDNYEDRLTSVSDGLGQRAGQEFLAALAAGEIPKVAALLQSGIYARAGGIANSTLLEKEALFNPRPFVVAPERINQYDHAGGDIYASLGSNGSYPSGHTSQAYWIGILLSQWFPEVAPQILARAAEVGNSRIVLGVHYPLDVIGGRIHGQAVAAQRLNDPEFRELLDQGRDEVRAVLERRLGAPLPLALALDQRYTVVDGAQFHKWLTYGFPQTNPEQQNDIPAAAASLIEGQYPYLTAAQRLDILRATALPAGSVLDKAGADGGWARIDLYAALSASVNIDPLGSVAVAVPALTGSS